MPCTTNSAHARHTFLRGCCESACPCPGIASYQAGRYCECNETTAQNQVISFRDELCRVLLATFTATNYSSASFRTLIATAGLFSSVRCGTFDILVGSTLEGTVTNGVYTTAGSPTLAAGTYLIHIDNVTLPECTTVTIV